MRISLKTIVAGCTGLAGIAGALASPFPAQAEPAPRVAVTAESRGPSPLPRADAVRLLRQQGLARGAKVPAGTLATPFGVTVDQSSNVYVSNLSGGVTIYSPALKLVGAITAGINVPTGIGIAFDGNIYVANNGGNNITIYNSSLTQIGSITDPTVAYPDGLFIDAEDDVWLLDGMGVLHGYLNDGNLLPSLQTGGSAVGQWGPNVTVWGVANQSGGYDEKFQNRSEAVRFGPSLQNVYSNGSPEAGGEAQDQNALEYVSDIAHDQVQIWSRNGASEVGVIATPSSPYGVAVDTVHDRVYVAMPILNEVYAYSTKAPYRRVGIIR